MKNESFDKVDEVDRVDGVDKACFYRGFENYGDSPALSS